MKNRAIIVTLFAALSCPSCIFTIDFAENIQCRGPGDCIDDYRCVQGRCQDVGPQCGDLVVDAGELCDDGNVSAGDGCSADCKSDETCGNNVRDAGEACDDGNTVGGDGCSADCLSLEGCGNGIQDVGESCDDGADNGSYDKCKTDCSGPGPYCGDGNIDTPNEVCESSLADPCEACLSDCSGTVSNSICGDGQGCVGQETCDDGFTDACGTCNANCSGTGSGSTCGDSITCDEDEECDDGDSDNTDACIACADAFCGDGFVQAGVEECDGSVTGGSCVNCVVSCTGGYTKCGTECVSGTVCTALQLVSMGAGTYSGIDVDATHVYYGGNDGATGFVARIPKDGGVEQILESNGGSVTFVKVDGTHVYWTDFSDAASGGSVRRKNKDGSGSASVFASGQDNPHALALNSTHVYWTTAGSSDFARRKSKSGGSVTDIKSGQGYGIAVDGTYVFYADWTDYSVWRSTLSGGSDTSLDSALEGPWAIAIDGTYVYWTNQWSGAISRMAKTGGSRTEIITGYEARDNDSLWVYNGEIYWADRSGGIIYKATLPGGTNVTPIATGQTNPRSIVVDASGAYWVNASEVMKLAP